MKENFNKLLEIIHLMLTFENFVKIYRKCTAEPHSFLVNDTTLPSNDSLSFRENLLK